MTYRVAIPSAGRPLNVAKIQALASDLEVYWYVPDWEVSTYYEAGANNVVAAGELIPTRNQILDEAHAAGEWAVEIADDLVKLRRWDGFKAEDITLRAAIESVIEAMTARDAYLGGVAPTDNSFFSKGGVRETHFVVNDFIIVRPTELRFDAAMRLKEDYDYTAQHITRYGRVCRCDFILASFKHRTNRGGAVAYRTSELEQEAIAYLERKWPNAITRNPKKPDEILFKWGDKR